MNTGPSFFWGNINYFSPREPNTGTLVLSRFARSIWADYGSGSLDMVRARHAVPLQNEIPDAGCPRASSARTSGNNPEVLILRFRDDRMEQVWGTRLPRGTEVPGIYLAVAGSCRLNLATSAQPLISGLVWSRNLPLVSPATKISPESSTSIE